jgi:hypothetical protein
MSFEAMACCSAERDREAEIRKFGFVSVCNSLVIEGGRRLLRRLCAKVVGVWRRIFHADLKWLPLFTLPVKSSNQRGFTSFGFRAIGSAASVSPKTGPVQHPEWRAPPVRNVTNLHPNKPE